MLGVTLDTNTLGVWDALDALGDLKADVATASVTAREVEGTSWASRVATLKFILRDRVKNSECGTV